MRWLNDKEIDNGLYRKRVDVGTLRPLSDYLGELFYDGGQRRDDSLGRLPWSKCQSVLAFREGDVTVWAGYNGSGKSTLLNQLMLFWVSERFRCCLVSLEMTPFQCANRLVRQFAGTKNYNPEMINALNGWSSDKIWIYDRFGHIAPERLLDIVMYAAEDFACQHIFIDSLMKIDLAVDDFSGQKFLIQHLTRIAMRAKAHIHLICHSRKKDDEAHRMNKFDVRGAGEITDMAANVLALWRRKGDKKADNDADAVLAILKNRHEGSEPRFKLWFHQDAEHYVARPDGAPLNFRLADES